MPPVNEKRLCLHKVLPSFPQYFGFPKNSLISLHQCFSCNLQSCIASKTPRTLFLDAYVAAVFHIGYLSMVSGNLAGLYFLPRSGWGAVPPRAHLDPLKLPVPNIIYTHTAEISQCSVTEECCNQVKNIQYLHMNKRADSKNMS